MTVWEGFRVELPSYPPVDDAWKELLGSWEDEAAHKRFLDRAAQYDGLDVAAALYRDVQRQRPADPRAAAALERLVVLAQDLYAARALAGRPPKGPTRIVAIGAAIVVDCSLLAVLYFVWRG